MPLELPLYTEEPLQEPLLLEDSSVMQLVPLAPVVPVVLVMLAVLVPM
jgi:hypothetical protein